MTAADQPALDLEAGGARDLDEVMMTMAEAFDPAFGEAWNRAQCLGILDLPGVWLTLARRAGRPAGFALSRMVMDEAELLLLAVRPSVRARGVGGALLERTLAAARKRGAARLHLEMRDGNDALRLYARAGFSEIGRRPAYYRGKDGQLFDALTLACPLHKRI